MTTNPAQRRTRLFFPLLALLIVFASSVRSQETTRDKILMVHTMPWYASKPVSGAWGWHWTMNHFNPGRTDSSGKHEIASQVYPLIGPYDSSDPDLVEYQALLMKFSGIDGVIADWYGVKDFYDYGFIQRCTLTLVDAVKKAGLSFAVCYEDQTIKHMIDGGGLDASNAVAHGQEVMRWLEENWFNEEWYWKIGGRPALLVFGPQYYSNAQWTRLFSVLKIKPFFFTLNTAQPVADGYFGWPPVQAVTPANPLGWKQALEDQYNNANGEKPLLGTVFPQFHDIYREAGVSDGYARIGDQNGETFVQTLKMGVDSRSAYLQLVTWNDCGEGTVIEPTREFGYRFLEDVQAYRKASRGEDFSFSESDLRLPGELYRLRKEYASAREKQELDEIAELLYAADTASAAERIRLFIDSREAGVREAPRY
ncbi:MAG: hypothetical protein GC154_08095 [bacterium]|nr:hypothetical protein [bacterium]